MFQLEGVRLYSADQLFGTAGINQHQILEKTPTERKPHKQEKIAEDAANALQIQLKAFLEVSNFHWHFLVYFERNKCYVKICTPKIVDRLSLVYFS